MFRKMLSLVWKILAGIGIGLEVVFVIIFGLLLVFGIVAALWQTMTLEKILSLVGNWTLAISYIVCIALAMAGFVPALEKMRADHRGRYFLLFIVSMFIVLCDVFYHHR